MLCHARFLRSTVVRTQCNKFGRKLRTVADERQHQLGAVAASQLAVVEVFLEASSSIPGGFKFYSWRFQVLFLEASSSVLRRLQVLFLEASSSIPGGFKFSCDSPNLPGKVPEMCCARLSP